MAEKEQARRRLAFDELLRVQLVLVLRKRALERESRGIRHDGRRRAGPSASTPRCRSRSPARSSARSPRSTRDLAGPHPMHRLLQGDVGSGKTRRRRQRAARRGAGRPPGRADGADRGARRAARHRRARAARRRRRCPTRATCSATGRCASSCSPTASPAASGSDVLAGLADGIGRHRHRHPRADPGGRRVPQPRRRRDRRAAPLRRRAAGRAARRRATATRCPTCW